MLFTTTTQYVALAVALVAGWLFGLASHPGGKRWKTRYHTERDAHAGVRKEYETKLTAANTRIKELERENERLAKAVPVAAPAPAVAPAPATATPRTQPTAAPTSRTGASTGWFDWKNRVGTTSRY